MPLTTPKEAPMHRHTRIAGIALALATIAAAAPLGAQARHAPGDLVAPQPHTAYSSARLDQIDQLGPKYVTVRRPASPGVAVAPSTRGFDWPRTGTVGGAVLGLVLIAGAAVVIRRRHAEQQPE